MNMGNIDEILTVLAGGMAVASPILIYSAFKTKNALNRARYLVGGIVLAATLPLANFAIDRHEGIERCEQLLKENGAVTSTINQFEQNILIGQFCYNDQIRGDFLKLIDNGLETKLAYEKASENYRSN